MTIKLRSLLTLPVLLSTAKTRVTEAQNQIAALTDQRDRAIVVAEKWRLEAERLRDLAESRGGEIEESTG